MIFGSSTFHAKPSARARAPARPTRRLQLRDVCRTRRCDDAWAGSIRMGEVSGYPLGTLWWTNILPWKDPPFFMGTSTISTGPFSIAMLNYQRVSYMAHGFQWLGLGFQKQIGFRIKLLWIWLNLVTIPASRFIHNMIGLWEAPWPVMSQYGIVDHCQGWLQTHFPFATVVTSEKQSRRPSIAWASSGLKNDTVNGHLHWGESNHRVPMGPQYCWTLL